MAREVDLVPKKPGLRTEYRVVESLKQGLSFTRSKGGLFRLFNG